MRRTLVVCSLIFVAAAVAADRLGTLVWPLPSSQTVTGGFADTRPDHFHGGVDLRAREPQPVIAPTDGWVERIAVNPLGYGRVLYFRLQDGRTAVFGHLSRFVPAIEQAMRDSQLVHGTYRIDVCFPEQRPELTFRQGATVAFTGKTGVGPAHLHFEVREGAVQTDPLANYTPVDQLRPVITRLSWTTLSGYSPTSSGTPLVAATGGRWLTRQRRPIRVAEPIAFYIQAYDPGPWGRNAVPMIVRVRVNGQIVHEEFPGRIDLTEPKSFFRDIVWAERLRTRRTIRRLFSPPPPSRFAFTPFAGQGWLSGLNDADVTIEVEDRAGNITSATVPVTCGEVEDPDAAPPPTALRSGAFTLANHDPSLGWAVLSSNSQTEITISPADMGFSQPCTLSYHFTTGSRTGLFFYQRISATSVRPLWRIPAFDNRESISCEILRGGTYGVALDSIPPRVTCSVSHGALRFNVADALSWVDDSTIRCTVDGSTAIAEFEYADRSSIIWTREPLTHGTHEVEITAGDRAGNLTTRRTTVVIR